MRKRYWLSGPAIGLLLICCGLLTGCRLLIDVQCEQYLQGMLQAVEAENLQVAVALFYDPDIADSSFEQEFAEMVCIWEKGPYTYTCISMHARSFSGSGGGRKYVTNSYAIQTAQKKYHAEVIRCEMPEGDGLYGFRLKLEQAEKPVGTLRDIGSFTGGQWSVLLYYLAAVAFCVVTAVRCAKDPIRMKWLWILLILLVHSGMEHHVRQGLFQLRLLLVMVPPYYRLLLYPGGGRLLALGLPVGAILYWCIRKKLIANAEKKQQSQDKWVAQSEGSVYGQPLINTEEKPADAEA